MKKTVLSKTAGWLLVAIIPIVFVSNAKATANPITLSGVITDKHSEEVVPFANLAIYGQNPDQPLSGTSADADGRFALPVPAGDTLQLWISAMGYITHKQYLYATYDQKEMVLDQVRLIPHSHSLEEVLVEADRLKAIMEGGSITYLVNKSMLNAASTGTDLLSLIPGVHRTIHNELVVDGNREVLIMVNGIPRDRQFVQQIKATMIDRIEVNHSPSSAYDGQHAAMLHIILTEESDRGIEGHVFLESPSSPTQIYAFPSYSLRYGTGRINLFTSYSGEISYFDIIESDNRQQTAEKRFIDSRQEVFQKYWSHRFHAGADLTINKRNLLNLYAFYNPFSQRHDGMAITEYTGSDQSTWVADKKDKDINHAFQYSVFYKHILDQEDNHHLSLDFSQSFYTGKNSISYLSHSDEQVTHNASHARQQRTGFRLDYSRPINNHIVFLTGIHLHQRFLWDELLGDFDLNGHSGAAYTAFKMNKGNWDLQTGIRYEQSVLNGKIELMNSTKAILPSISWQYRLKGNRFIQMAYRKSTQHPTMYQLNPSVYKHDRFVKESGNPMLRPAVRQTLYAEYTKRFEHHVVATRLFFNHTTDAIHYLTVLDADQVFMTSPGNLGNMSSFGMRTNAAVRVAENVNLSSSAAIFYMATSPNGFGKDLHLTGRGKLAFETSVALYATFANHFTASVMIQHASPELLLQGESYGGTMYMAALDKELGHGLKAGIVSVLPFSGTFTYQGFTSHDHAFSHQQEGQIQLTAVPVWLRLSYQFSSGKNRVSMHRTIEETEVTPRRGF